jgi:hypothetical protein
LGIGTSSPTIGYRLDILGNSGYDDIMRITGVGTNIGPRINLAPTGTGISRINATANSLQLQTSGTPALTIDSSQNVGIGTSSPSGELHIKASSGFATVYVQGSNSSSGMYLFDQGSEAGLWKVDSGYLAFGTNNAERLRIDSSGTVKISHADTASEGLRVIQTTAARTSGGSLGLFYDDQAGTTQPTLKVIQNGTGDILQLFDGGTQAVTVKDGGNLLVGCTALPSGGAGGAGFESGQSGGRTILQLGTTVTSSEAVARFYNPNGAIGSISLSGSSTAYNTSSDQRLKENIADADDAGSKIDAIQVRKYDWKADGSHQDYGMIAQELLEVAPEAVSGDADSEEMMGVDYSKLVPMLIKEIQSLRNRVAQLEE